MRILFIHNKYKLSGGEDQVLENEKNILESNDHKVKTVFFDNTEIESISDKLKLSYQLLYNKRSEKIVREAILEFMPDIVHIHNLFYLASPSVLYAAHESKIPVVLTLHNYRLICSGALLMRDSKPCELCVGKIFPVAGVRYGCHRGSRLQTAQLTLAVGAHKLLNTWAGKVSRYIALTEFAKEKFIHSSLNLRPEQIVAKPNSVDDVGLSDVSEREDYFLFAGRLSHEKGIEVALKAFENKSAKLEIMGEGPLKDVVEKAAKRNTNIKYLGYGDKSSVIAKLKKCRALIVPSVCYENLPTAVLEAFSSGTPVVISDIGNLNEIVAHEYNGIHFKTNDPADLYEKVRVFPDKDSRYEQLCVNSRQTYLEKYTKQINYKNLIAIYESAIKQLNATKIA